MPPDLSVALQALEAQRQAILHDLATWDEAARAARPRPGKWSALEIAEHLVLAERVILQDLPPAGALVARPREFKHRSLYWVVVAILRFRIPVKVPTRRMAPAGGRSLAEITALWDENFRWLRAHAQALEPGDEARAVFRHPVAGPITLAQALRMAQLHLAIHLRQLQQLKPQAHPGT